MLHKQISTKPRRAARTIIGLILCSYGAFPRVAARYLREMNVLTLQEAIR